MLTILRKLEEELNLFRYASTTNNNVFRVIVAMLAFFGSLFPIIYGMYGIKLFSGEDKRSWAEVVADGDNRLQLTGVKVSIGIAAVLSVIIFWSMGVKNRPKIFLRAV